MHVLQIYVQDYFFVDSVGMYAARHLTGRAATVTANSWQHII